MGARGRGDVWRMATSDEYPDTPALATKYDADDLEAADHGHLLILEEGWEQPFKDILDWLETALVEESAETGA